MADWNRGLMGYNGDCQGFESSLFQLFALKAILVKPVVCLSLFLPITKGTQNIYLRNTKGFKTELMKSSVGLLTKLCYFMLLCQCCLHILLHHLLLPLPLLSHSCLDVTDCFLLFLGLHLSKCAPEEKLNVMSRNFHSHLFVLQSCQAWVNETSNLAWGMFAKIS